MKIGIMIGENEPEKVKSRANELKSYGYSAVDFQGLMHTEDELFSFPENKFEKTLLACAEYIRSAGLEIAQTHGPWRYPILDGTPELRAERFESMSKALRGSAYLGSKYMVVHPIMPYGTSDNDPNGVREINREFFGRLAPLGKEYSVTICLENMPFPGQSQASVVKTLKLIEDIGQDNIAFCLDTGHCLITGEDPAEAVALAGEKLRVLHVHDNDGKRDIHLSPGDGIIDWTAFGLSLVKYGFDGSFSLETTVKGENITALEKDAAERELFSRANSIVKG